MNQNRSEKEPAKAPAKSQMTDQSQHRHAAQEFEPKRLPEKIQKMATSLREAFLAGAPIEQLSRQNSFSEAEAYAIQDWQMQQALQDSNLLGWKMGLTSEAKRKQMNLHSPLYGFLTNKMQTENTFSMSSRIHPKVEPEIAFRLKHDLDADATLNQAEAAIDSVASALEILDSRYTEFRYFSLEDVIADNSSSCAFVLGPWVQDFSLSKIRAATLQMSIDGELRESGTALAISGDPVISILQLAQLLGKNGKILKAGQIVLAGAATAAVALKPGMKVSLQVSDLLPCEFTVEE